MAFLLTDSYNSMESTGFVIFPVFLENEGAFPGVFRHEKPRMGGLNHWYMIFD